MIITTSPRNGQIERIQVTLERGLFAVATGTFITTAGLFLRRVGSIIGIDLPVFNELHGKVAFTESLGIVAREAPLMIWNVSLTLPWTEDERDALMGQEETSWPPTF